MRKSGSKEGSELYKEWVRSFYLPSQKQKLLLFVYNDDPANSFSIVISLFKKGRAAETTSTYYH